MLPDFRHDGGDDAVAPRRVEPEGLDGRAAQPIQHGRPHDRARSMQPRLDRLFAQLAIPAPRPPDGSFDRRAADHGQTLFNGPARCSTCHVPPLFSEPGWAMHTADEIGIDDFQASRAPDKRYRTTPLKGVWAHLKSL